MKDKALEQSKGADVLGQDDRAKMEELAKKLKPDMERAVKSIRQLRERRQKVDGSQSLVFHLARIRVECGSFAAWMAIARIAQRPEQKVSQADRIHIEKQKEILRRSESQRDKDLQQLFDL